MAQFDYHKITKTEYNATKELSNAITDVIDVAHLGPWKKHRDENGTVVYTYNNIDSNPIPPLLLYIRDDDVIELNTTAYGETTITGLQCKLARKAVPRGDSALEWVEEHFDLSE